jgi:hypothetical protein
MKSNNQVRLSLEVLEDRMVPSSMGTLPGFTGSSPPSLTSPPSMYASLPGFTQQSPPSGQPSLPANVIAMADQIFLEWAAMLQQSKATF